MLSQKCISVGTQLLQLKALVVRKTMKTRTLTLHLLLSKYISSHKIWEQNG